jgi:protoheme IX farnesyltransferase
MDSLLTPPSSSSVSQSTAGDFFSLLKPRVMSLVVFSGFAGYWVAPGREELHPVLAAIALLALALGAGASGAFNMWYDRDIDAVMNRTKGRAIPMGKIAADDALGFAIFVTLLSVMIMGLVTNWMAAGILAFASFFYTAIYTMYLKRRTAQNIVIGGAAGAFPPMVGWAMVTGDITLDSIILFLIIFIWTPPHFWALALFANEDYQRANIPMMPVTHGASYTKKQMLAYTIILLPVTLAPFILGMANWLYAVIALALGLLFILSAVRVMGTEDMKPARQMFGYSVFYLFALFLTLMLCHN